MISHFEEAEDQKRAADIFYENTLAALSIQEKEKALKEIIRKIREYSLSYDAEHTTDLAALQRIFQEKEALRKLDLKLSV